MLVLPVTPPTDSHTQKF